MANAIETKIHQQLQVIEWQIRDAKEDILRSAQLYARSAECTLRHAEELTENKPSGICSTSFLPSSIENGTAAYHRLTVLCQKRDLLMYLLQDTGNA